MFQNGKSLILAAAAGLAVSGLAAMAAGGPAKAEDLLKNGGSITSAPTVGPIRGDESFLRDGGSVRVDPRIGIANGKPHQFLAGGGGIRQEPDIVLPRSGDRLDSGKDVGTEPDIYSTSDREEFLEGGGSITDIDHGAVVYRVHRRSHGWHFLDAAASPRPVVRNSFTTLSFTVGGDGSYETSAYEGSFAPAPGSFASGPRIIDVATERLDRRPIPSSGIEVISRGGAKIIRIASGYDRANAAQADKGSKLVPWSQDWRDWCGNAYASFDPSRGTYTGADGSEHFCTGR
ncbi:BA14K family protein [Jiella sp. M17.18]|uniref:BA14K family protein n=1 Tax=Jiella sp. M17.18 TaxID=3234247 RepID=UPI0034DFB0EA